MGRKLLVLGLAVALPLALAGQDSPQPANQPGQQLSKSDKGFLKALIREDISEINLAKLALQKSSNPQVKNYAKTKILAADPQMRAGAERIARKHGMTPPSAPNARQKKIYDQLSKKSGKVFDNAYMNYETSQQTGDIKLVNSEIKSTSSPEMKTYLRREGTPVQEAAMAAKEVSKKISSSMTNFHRQVSGKGSTRHR